MVNGTVGGYVDFNVNLQLFDPNNDGRVRYTEIWSILNASYNPLDLFLFQIRAAVDFHANLTVFGLWSYVTSL